MAGDGDDAQDLTQGTHEPRECMACRGTGRVISNLGGSPSTVQCPWCNGSGLRPAEIDAQANRGRLRLVENAPLREIGTVGPGRPPRRVPNKERRDREHLTPSEVELLYQAAKRYGRYGQRDALIKENYALHERLGRPVRASTLAALVTARRSAPVPQH